MIALKLKLGGIYKTEWDEKPLRVIGFDDFEVFYDCLWPHDNSWAFSGNFKKKCYFYRISASFFISKSTLIDYVPLTIEELKVFRPDLPMRVARTRELNWNSIEIDNYNNFIEHTKTISDRFIFDEKIPSEKIVLIPFGNNGGLKKGTILSADNSNYFECVELVWKAKELQAAVNDQTSNGIGIYRIGFENELPSYYIGEYMDRAGFLTE
jgi:hypothetical protein